MAKIVIIGMGAGAFSAIMAVKKVPGNVIVVIDPKDYDKAPLHVKEFKPDELKDFLLKKFSSVEVLGLNRGRRHKFYNFLKKSGVFNMLPSNLNPVNKLYPGVWWYLKNADHYNLQGGRQNGDMFESYQ